MNVIKTFVATAAIALASFGANASQISSGGITWDPDYDTRGGDFFALADYKRTTATSGFGQIASVNGQFGQEFCAYNSVCSLSFTYSDNTLNFFVNTYANTGMIDAGVNSAANVETGDLWLSFALNVSATGASQYSSSQATYFDVLETAGTSFSNFDTNSLLNDTDLSFGIIIPAQGDNWGYGGFQGDSIPEPTSLAIFGLGLLGLAGAARRKA